MVQNSAARLIFKVKKIFTCVAPSHQIALVANTLAYYVQIPPAYIHSFAQYGTQIYSGIFTNQYAPYVRYTNTCWYRLLLDLLDTGIVL